MKLDINNRPSTTFVQDFRIAEHFGEDAIRDTFKLCQEWKGDIAMYTELVVALNMLCWYHYDAGNSELSRTYSDLYYAARDYVWDGDNFNDDERRYFFQITD